MVSRLRRGSAAIIPVAAAVVVIALIGTAAWMLRPGSSISADFAQRQKISADAVLHFSFPVEMDHASVEQNMIKPDALEGEWTWDGETLLFDPTERLAAGETYVFALPPVTMTSENLPLGRALEFSFQVAGPPSVTATMPTQDATDIERTSRITIIFDRAMIPLAQVQGEASEIKMENWTATIDPPVAGRWRWLSTVAVEFVPETTLQPATRYEVKVPAGILSSSGDATTEDFTWSFETERPTLLSSSPEAHTNQAGPTSVIRLQFNEPLALGTAQQAVRLERLEGSARKEVALKPVRYGRSYNEDLEKEIEDRASLLIEPSRPMTLDSSYALTISEELRVIGGNLGPVAPIELPFKTAGPLTVTRAVYEWGAISVDFSSMVTGDSLHDALTIDPPVEGWEDLYLGVDDDKEMSTSGIYIYPTLKPSTEYTVTFAPTLTDVYGQKLEKPYVMKIKTDPLRPEVFIHSRAEFGIFERGKPPVYYLNAINVSKVDLEFAKLPFEEFLEIRSVTKGNYAMGPSSLKPYPEFREWTLVPKKEQDKWHVTPFDVSERVGSSLLPGIYAFSARAPEYEHEMGGPGHEYQYFAITDIALTLKYSGTNAMIWAVNMQTGEPVKGAVLTFYALNGTKVVAGITDAEGFFDTPIDIKQFATVSNDWEPEFFVTAETADDFAFVGSLWSDGIRPWDFNLSGDFRGPQAAKYRMDSYLYTERPLYRAGDTVGFKGMVRLRDWEGNMSLPAAPHTMHIRVDDPSGNVAYEGDVSLNEFGGFSGSFPIDESAALGAYYLNAQMLPDGDVEWGNAYSTFSVLAYRKPEYNVEVTMGAEEYFDDQTVEATIDGSYYFGAPMAGAQVSWRAQTSDYFFNRYTEGWYSFGLEDAWCWWECERETEMIAEGKGKLDAAGRLKIRVPIDISDKAMSQILTIEADVTDENNQVVSSRGSAPVHKADAYVGVRTEDYVVSPGSNAAIGVVTVKTDGTPLPNQTVRVALYQRTWNTIRTKGVDGEFYYENEPKDTFVRETTVTTDEGGKAIARVRVDEGGEQRIVATVRDAAGRESKSATTVYVWSDTYVNWPHTNSDRIEIVADRPQYSVGDTAKLLVKSPFQGKGVKALVTVEREGVISRQLIDVESNAQAIEVPITEELLPNVFVSVVVIKPRIGETFNEFGLDTGAPAYRIGYVQLPIETSHKELTVTITPDKKRYLPGEKVFAEILVTDWEGKPASAEVTLGVVDMSVLALSSFEHPRLVDIFYANRGLGVNTAQMLQHLLERFKPGSKGGGGGDLESRARGTFKDTAYWNPSIVTDAKGEAHAEFTLPDNLTTWHFLSLAQSKDHRFGAGEATAIATKRVIVRPVRPRFAVIGDQPVLGAIVHNFTEDPQTFTVRLAGSGFTIHGSSETAVTLEADAQQKLLFPVTVSRGTQMTMRFTAETKGARDEITETIPVYLYGTPQAVATAGMTEDIAAEKVLIPSEKDASSVSLKTSMAPTLAVYLPEGLDYVGRFPYGCTEQTISSILPAIALAELREFGAFQAMTQKELDNKVIAGIERLTNFQRSDGGYGFWEGSQQSYPSLSAYVLLAFDTATEAGYSVDDGVVTRLRSYLSGVLRETTKEKLDLATRAEILFALSESGDVDVALLSNLSDQRKDLPLFARAELAMAFQNAGEGRRAEEILKEVLDRAKISGRGTHFEEEELDLYHAMMHTNDRTTALALRAMIRIEPDHALIPSTVRHMLAVREDGHWDTTQSTSQSLLSFVEFLRSTDETSASYDAALRINGEKTAEWEVRRSNLLERRDVEVALTDLKRGQLNDVTFEKEGKGRLYYDVLLSYFYTGETLPAAEEGISIRREMSPVRGAAKDPTVGGTYRFTLTITVPEDRHFVAVESPLPGGFEAVDLTLATSPQVLFEGLASDDQKNDWWNPGYWESGLWYFNHTEYRDDRVFLFADYLPAGVYQYHYLARATTPGTFHERPAHAWQMYFPEVFGQTEGKSMTIRGE